MTTTETNVQPGAIIRATSLPSSNKTLKIGDTLAFKGPLGHFDFDCAPADVPRDTLCSFTNDTLCSFTNEGAPAQYMHLGLIAGGSGITPCLQVAMELLTSTAKTRRLGALRSLQL